MPEHTRVAVVCGGPSAEAEVSRVSGRGVANALRSTYANVALLELDGQVGDALRENRTDVVFPVLHGPPGEDGTFQGFLEILGLPYVGSGVHASACAMDKIVAKSLFRLAGLPVAPDLIARRQDGMRQIATAVRESLGSKVVVKPSRQGSALGVQCALEPAALEAGLAEAFRYDECVLIEACVDGREIMLGSLSVTRWRHCQCWRCERPLARGTTTSTAIRQA